MMRLSVKACLRLLCGMSVLLSVEAQSTVSTSMLLTSETRDPGAVPATAHTAAPRTEEAAVRSSNGSVAGLVVVTSATTSSAPPTLRTPTAATPARPAGDVQTPRHTTVSETSKPTADQTHRGSSNAYSDGATAPTTPAASSASPTKPEVTSNLSPSNTSIISTPSSSTRTVSNSSTQTSPVMSTETLNTSSTTTSHPTSQFPKTAGSTSQTETSASSASNSSSNSTSAVSTSPAGIFPKRLTSPSTTSTTSASAAPCKVSKVPPSTPDVQPCSTRSLISPCLIAIASLAVLATIFMVSTIVLCSRLSSRRYKVRRHKQSTEMMCISALLPEEDVTYTRRRGPIANGILVIPSCGDSEEEGGDNVTLSSFLPDNDHYV